MRPGKPRSTGHRGLANPAAYLGVEDGAVRLEASACCTPLDLVGALY
jgi:hypothetical protein